MSIGIYLKQLSYLESVFNAFLNPFYGILSGRKNGDTSNRPERVGL